MKTSKTVTIPREELYNSVWNAPMRDVAAELGISDVGLKKVCKRHGIPTPPQGYHLMKDGPAKQRAHRDLPPMRSEHHGQVSFEVPSKTVTALTEEAAARARALLQQEQVVSAEVQRAIA